MIKDKLHKTIAMITAVTLLFGSLTFFTTPVSVHAAGELTVLFENSPLFMSNNMAPGDSEVKNITVTNNESTPYLVAIKGNRVGPDGETDPLLESVLELTVHEGALLRYSGTVQDFFNDSADDGIPLSVLPLGDTTIYTLTVTFPTTAGNEFQNKSVIFDLAIGFIQAENIVINEVYYEVDSDKGYDSPKDRGITGIGGNNITVIISENGDGSVNTVTINLQEICKITQGNNVNITNVVNQTGDTGGNTASQNNGPTSIFSGFISQILNIFNFGGFNIASCGKKLQQNHEWIEVYNPTAEEINLKNWTLTDNSGIFVTINGNQKIKPGHFGLITANSSTWSFWDEDSNARKINLGSQIGDGLDNDGDHIILRNPDGDEIDAVGWGNDTDIWNPAVPLVNLDASIERIGPGIDTNTPSDWEERDPPTPGS